MFNQLVESRSHHAEARRKSRFFLGTLGLYALLIAALGVGSIYAYDVHLEQAGAEELILVMPVVPMHTTEDTPRTARPEPPKNVAGANSTRELPERKDLIADVRTPLMPDKVSTIPSNALPIPNSDFVRGLKDTNPIGGLPSPVNGTRSLTASEGGVRVKEAEIIDPPPPTSTPKPPLAPQKPVSLTSKLITSKVISKPVPPYPAPAKIVRAQGPVTVEILVDEQGRVISARATSGHPFLRVAAQQAALQARFSPTILGTRPVKVTGVITYNFVLQ